MLIACFQFNRSFSQRRHALPACLRACVEMSPPSRAVPDFRRGCRSEPRGLKPRGGGGALARSGEVSFGPAPADSGAGACGGATSERLLVASSRIHSQSLSSVMRVTGTPRASGSSRTMWCGVPGDAANISHVGMAQVITCHDSRMLLRTRSSTPPCCGSRATAPRIGENLGGDTRKFQLLLSPLLRSPWKPPRAPRLTARASHPSRDVAHVAVTH